MKLVICKECNEEKKHHAKGLCRDCYAKRWKRLPRKKWSLYHNKCIKCKTIRYKHIGRGLCVSCYHKEWYHKRNPNAKYRRDWILDGGCNECKTIKRKHYSNGLCKRCYDKKYTKEHLEKIRESWRKGDEKYRATHKREINKYRKKWYEKNKERKKEMNKRWVEKNRERKRELDRRWAEEHPKKIKISDLKSKSKRRLRLLGFIEPKGISESTQRKVRIRDHDACVYKSPLCNEEIMTYDHIIAITKFKEKIGMIISPNNFNNLVIACKSCNDSKNNKDVFEWCEEKGIPVPQIVIESLKKTKRTDKFKIKWLI